MIRYRVDPSDTARALEAILEPKSTTYRVIYVRDLNGLVQCLAVTQLKIAILS